MVENLLVVLHSQSNAGYAIAPLERVFWQMAQNLVQHEDRIHFAYKSLERGHPDTLPSDFPNVAALDIRDRSREGVGAVVDYVGAHGIDTVFAFDAPVSLPSYGPMRTAGVQRIISYQGAPMSSLFAGWRLLAKRFEVSLRRSRPDHFIFESEAMRDTAVNGRGVPHADTSVVHLGADGERFHPRGDGYAHRTFGIPEDRSILVYSGHMEQRKGVHVLVQALRALVEKRGRRDVHLLILGNRPGQEDRFRPLYADSPSSEFLTFGGYRNDMPEIFGSADIAAIASTGWDSFTMSSVEMALSGLPLVVSHLQGLVETVDPGTTGFTFPPGDAGSLADHVVRLLDNADLRNAMGAAARNRALAQYSVGKQVMELTSIVERVCGAAEGTAARSETVALRS